VSSPSGPVRLLPQSGDTHRWEVPPLDTGARARSATDPEDEPLPQPPTLEQIEAIQREAHEEGFAAGHAEGLEQARAEMRRLQARLEGILDAFSRPLSELEGEVESSLVDLASRIAGTLVRQTYREHPALLAKLTREALDSLGERSRSVEVRLHPEDLEAVEPLLPAVSGARLIADAALARGDLRVHAEDVRLDARLNTRLAQMLSRLLALADQAGAEAQPEDDA